MGKRIPTLAGTVDVEQMGFTLIHEHILFWPIEEELRDIAEAFVRMHMKRAVSRGIGTMVEVTPHRDVRWLQEICKGMDMHVILSTGRYCEGTPFIPNDQIHWTLDQECDRMEKEILEGIDGTAVKAGVLKVAGNGSVLTPWEEKMFVAAAKVSTKTRTPICTHACAGQAAQQAALLKGGADLNHVYYSHPEAEFGWEGRTPAQQADYFVELVRHGSSLMFNNFDFEFDTPKEDMSYLLRELAYRGYTDRILISIDQNFEVDGDGTVYPEASRSHPHVRCRNYAYVADTVVPYLLDIGFSKDEIDTIFIRNPRRIFDF